MIRHKTLCHNLCYRTTTYAYVCVEGGSTLPHRNLVLAMRPSSYYRTLAPDPDEAPRSQVRGWSYWADHGLGASQKNVFGHSHEANLLQLQRKPKKDSRGASLTGYRLSPLFDSHPQLYCYHVLRSNHQLYNPSTVRSTPYQNVQLTAGRKFNFSQEF